jgi:hypothetical protein
MNHQNTRCEGCGAPPRLKDVCCFYCGTPWASRASQPAQTPSVRTKINTSRAVYDVLKDTDLTGDRNVINHAIDCKIVGDRNVLNKATRCKIAGDRNVVNQAIDCQVVGDRNVVQAG